MRLHAFLFCFLFVTIAGAQQLSLETYNPSNGLVDAHIRKIKQDKWGRLIFMCFEGFGIYDGQRFKNCKHVNGIPAGFLTEIAEDTDSTIYITGFNQYVFKIKGETICIDSSLRGKLPEPERLLNVGMHYWIVFGNGQVAEWRDNIIKNIQLPDFIDFVNYDMLDLYDSNLFFYNTIKGIFLIVNYKTGKITASLSSAPIESITADKEKNVFYKTTTGLFQLTAKDIAANRLAPVNASHLLSLIPDRFKKAGVSYWEDNNHFWSFLYRLGACRINIKTGKPEFFLAKDGLSLSASNVFVDAEANYWFLSEFHGVQKLPQKRLEVLKKFGNDDASFTTLTYPFNNESFALQATTGHYLVKSNLSKKINVPANARFYWQNDWWASKDLVHFTSSKGYKVRPANTNNAYHFTKPELFKTMFDKNNNVLITGSSLVLIDSMHTVLFTSLPYFTDNITQDDEHLYWAFCRSGHVICYQRKGDNLVAASDTLHMPPLFSPAMRFTGTGIHFLLVHGGTGY
jgi:hypothetical protein